MEVKDYTRVIKNNIIIIRRSGHMAIKDLIKELKITGITGRFYIEHVTRADKIYIAASYFFKDFKETGAVFPYGYSQSNKKLSL